MNEKENLTQEYIYSAFLQLLEKKHYDEISVCEICTKAGVSRMSFYRNFESKEDLTFKGIDRIVKNLSASIENLSIKNMFTITQETFIFAKKYKSALFSIMDSQITNTLKEMIITELQEKSKFDYISKTSKYIPVFYFSSIVAVLIEWLKNDTEETPEEMATLLTKLVNPETLKNACIEDTVE